jgi:hypothetical protein
VQRLLDLQMDNKDLCYLGQLVLTSKVACVPLRLTFPGAMNADVD